MKAKAFSLLFTVALCAPGQQRAPSAAPDGAREQPRSSYVLGPGDQITVRALEIEEFKDMAVRIDNNGDVRLPMAGRIRAGGQTIQQFEATLTERLKPYVLAPDVAVSVSEYRSQPVSVIGAVKTPGVQQVQGTKTLVEMLALAGGLDVAAGSKVKISRRLEYGPIPLRSAVTDSTGQFSVAEVSLRSIMEARNPEENISVQPYDVISVPKADMVYVIGQVLKSGGFVLNERENMSALTALSLAGGLDRAAKPQNARILRFAPGAKERTEMVVNLQKILDGKATDVPLQAEDILFVPSSAPKKAALRAVEAAIQAGTGIVIWRR